MMADRDYFRLLTASALRATNPQQNIEVRAEEAVALAQATMAIEARAWRTVSDADYPSPNPSRARG